MTTNDVSISINVVSEVADKSGQRKESRDYLKIRIGLNNRILIETAAQIADELGLAAVTLTEVSDRLGVRKPSLYNHVKGLPDLRKGLAVFGSSQLRARIGEAAVGKARQDAIRAIAAEYRLFAHERPGLYQAIVAWSDREDPAVKAATKELMEVFYAVLRGYRLQDEALVHAVRGLRSVMHGFVALEASGWFAQPAERDISYQQLLDTFVRGLEGLAGEEQGKDT